LVFACTTWGHKAGICPPCSSRSLRVAQLRCSPAWPKIIMGRDCSPDALTAERQVRQTHNKPPGAESQEMTFGDRRGECSPDPRRRTISEPITVLSLAGGVLCILDGSAKLLTIRELTRLIKARTGICDECQELLNGTERVSEDRLSDARPLANGKGSITLTLVKKTCFSCRVQSILARDAEIQAEIQRLTGQSQDRCCCCGS